MVFEVLGPVFSLLPERWRKALFGDAPINWPRAALISGVLEGVLCLIALIVWYLYFIQVAAGVQAEVTAKAMLTRDTPQGATGVGMSYAMGLAALTAFALHPLSWALFYFWLEGLLRACAAGLTQEVAGTLPLVLVDRTMAALGRRAYEVRVPLVADEVTRGDGKSSWDLKVASCRPKPTWKYPLTISYDGEFFQVVGESAGGATRARPHVYLLRRPPEGEAYKGVDPYNPQAILQSEEARPNFLVAAFRASVDKWRLERLPLVPDFVFNGDGKEGWHLRVESCRPKPHWPQGRTIRYEGRLYRVVDTCQGKLERPFGYRLRLLFEAEAARNPLDYTPDEPFRLLGK